MTEHFTSNVEITFADKETRTIRGRLIDTASVADRGGVSLQVAPQGVTYGERTPVLLGHDQRAVVGMMTAHEWTADGHLDVVLSIANTVAGTEALELASIGALALSAGFNPVKTQTSKDGSLVTVLSGTGVEASLVSVPALAGSLVTSVAFAAEDAHPTVEEGSAMTDDNGAVLAALETINSNLEKLNDRPVVVPTAVAKVTEPELYGPGSPYNMAHDVVAARFGNDASAATRLNAHVSQTFAVSSSDAMPGKAPSWRPDLGYANQRPYGRVLDKVISRGTLADNQPFSYPVLTAAATVAPHIEGVEPSLSGNAVWTTATITPSAVSGKASFTRETLDLVGGVAQDIIFAEMTKAAEKALEGKLRTMLDGLSLPAGQVKAITGTNVALMDSLDTVRLGLTEAQRFDGAVASPALFSALFLAKDTSGGRRLNTALNPVNANGTNNGLQSIGANGLTFIQGRDTDANGTVNSYLIDSSCVHQDVSAPKRLDFDVAVANVYMGFWMYSVEYITDKSGIIRLSYSAS